MKVSRLLIVIIPFFVLFSCEKEETEVEKYVRELKTNQYKDKYFPAFEYRHIDYLLKHRKEEYIITKYPRNPASSLYQEECKLGTYILWTIEYIRIKYVNSDLLVAEKFPSMNPVLKSRMAEELEFVYDANAYQIVSNAYYIWWTNNKDKSIEKIMAINPLESTEYAWY